VKNAIQEVKKGMDDFANDGREQMTNADVVKMVKEGMPESVILGQIRNSRPAFALESEDVIALVKNGVPEKVIEAMRNPRGGAMPTLGNGPGGVGGIGIPDGTSLRLVLAADVAADVKPGTPLAFTVGEDLRAGGTVLIPTGAPARGVVDDRTRKGKVYFRLLDAQAMGGFPLRLRAVSEAGERRSRLLDFGDGKSGEIVAKAGTPLFGYADGEQVLPSGPPPKKRGARLGPPRPPETPAVGRP
jgi:hypothetical protein